jgi:hypothetical protein
MIAVYGIFFAEIAAYRIGTKRLERLGVNYSGYLADFLTGSQLMNPFRIDLFPLLSL